MTTDRRVNDPFGEQEPATSPLRRWQLSVPIAMIVLIVGGLVGWSLWPQDQVAGPDFCDGPSGGLIRMDGECIGVTDGSYVLAPQLAREQQQILRQNAAIGSKRSVTVAVFNPLTPDATSALGIQEIRHQLQGTIVAQKWVNADADATNSVRIRLVLANQGSHQQHWEPVVDQLNRMKNDRSPLVATVGMGVSVQETLDAAHKLSEDKITSIGAVTTADQLDQNVAPSFFRVAPANSDYVAALLPWAKRFTSGLLVYDAASDDMADPDIFTGSLRDDVVQQIGASVALTAVNYHGSENSKDVQANRFGRIREKICHEDVPLVVFAGRRNDLEQFVEALKKRSCQTQVTVMVGGTDLGGLTTNAELADANISLVWSAGLDITGWEMGRNRPAHFGVFLDNYRSLYAKEDLADGQAVAGYDALMAVWTAAAAVEDESDDDDPKRDLPTGVDVRSALLNTATLGAIPAASGDLSYQRRDPKYSGNPIGRPIPVLQQGVPVDPVTDPTYVTHAGKAIDAAAR